MVDTNGLLVACHVTPANVSDRDGARTLLEEHALTLPKLKIIWADGNYDGPIINEFKAQYGITLEIVHRPAEQKGFLLLPRRWVVERTFAWLGRWRRLSKDYEQSPNSEQAFVHIAMIALMLKRLANT